MGTKPLRPPKGLDKAGAALWRAIAAQMHADGGELDARERQLLEDACRERDVLVGIEEEMVGQPRTSLGAQRQLVAHPLIGEARRSRQTIASLLKQINLDPQSEHVEKRGSATTSWQARAAAQARRAV